MILENNQTVLGFASVLVQNTLVDYEISILPFLKKSKTVRMKVQVKI